MTDNMTPGRAMAMLLDMCDVIPVLCEALEQGFEEISQSPVEEIAPRFVKLRAGMDALSKAKAHLNDVNDKVSGTIIPEAMTRQGIKNVTIKGVGRVQLGSRLSVKMLDKSAGYQWLRDNGAESLITNTVNANSLSAFVNNRLTEEGKDVPDDIFATTRFTYTSIVGNGK